MHILPEVVQEKINKLLSHYPLSRIKTAAQTLTQLYSSNQGSVHELCSEELYLAYLAFRLPATYAAVSDVCTRLLHEYSFCPRSMIDIGAGPGTAALAACEIFHSLQEVHLFERDAEFIRIGKEFSYTSWQWHCADVVQDLSYDHTADLTIASYSLGEMTASSRKKAVEFLWCSANKYVVIIEPGTPSGYETVMQGRDQLIAAGGHVVAPCPHNKPCPLRGNDWCHFSVRLPRTSFHRLVKEAVLGYEDEKFSYVVVSKERITHAPFSRIIRAPCKRSGHMYVTLCTRDEGIQNETISRKQKELYARAKKLEWGDSI